MEFSSDALESGPIGLTALIIGKLNEKFGSDEPINIATYIQEYYKLYESLEKENPVVQKEFLFNIDNCSDLKESVIQEIKSLFDRQIDQKNLLERNTQLVKNLISDILLKLFPTGDEINLLDTYIQKLKGESALPVRFIFLFRHLDKSTTFAVRFAELLHTFIIENTISSLRNLQLPQFQNDIYLKELLTINYVVTTAEDIGFYKSADETEKQYWDIQKIELEARKLKLDVKNVSQKVYDLYIGHPLLTSWHLEKLNEGIKEKDFLGGLTEFSLSAFEGLTDEDRFLIYAASVAGEIDSRLVSILLDKDFEYTKSALKKLNRFSYVVNSDNRISIRKPFNLLSSALPFDDKLFSKIEDINKEYLDFNPEIERFTDEDLYVLVYLAGFKSFDPTALYSIGKSRDFRLIQDLTSLVEAYPDIFVKDRSRFRLSDDIKICLQGFANLFPEDHFNAQISQVEVWLIYKKELGKSIKQLDTKKNTRSEQLIQFKTSLDKLSKEKTEIEGKLKIAETKEKNIFKSLGQFAEEKNDKRSTGFLVLAIIFGILYLFNDSIMSSLFDQQETLDVFSGLFIISFCIFLLLSSKLIYRKIVGLIKKDELIRKKDELANYRQELSGLYEKQTQIHADLSALTDKKNELTAEISELHTEKDILNSRLKDSFI
ncbi:MAG: hypothetical protein Kapaf2KO_06000 [Candidatus Kapaibacteriales bacterium]